MKCKVCNLAENPTVSIFITSEGDKKGVSPSEATFNAEENTSYYICQECYDKSKHLKNP